MIAERDGVTILTLTVEYPSAQARDAARETGMKDGMEVSYARLDDLPRSMERPYSASAL